MISQIMPISRKKCDFCSEIQGNGRTRFHDIYAAVLPNRIIANRQHFVALPTLGQLVPGSLLVLPKFHIETFAQLSEALQIEALHFINELELLLHRYGDVFIFEHGAQSSCGGGCGIYHAHIHIVPLPKPIRHHELIEYVGQSAENLFEVWSNLQGCSEYLVAKDSFGTVVSYKPNKRGFGSQYCRRRIAEFFNLEQPWDWKAYNSVEPFLLESVEMFRKTHKGVLDLWRF